MSGLSSASISTLPKAFDKRLLSFLSPLSILPIFSKPKHLGCESMAATLKIHWRVPTTIAVAFLAGLLFAIGHHLFFASLAGSLLDENVFNQQHNLAIGSAFAFLVRAALVISIGATYYQVLWRTLLGSGLQLQTVDALAGLLESLINLASWQVWSTGPLLVFIAAIAWLIPFATIVPPATLTVRKQKL